MPFGGLTTSLMGFNGLSPSILQQFGNQGVNLTADGWPVPGGSGDYARSIASQQGLPTAPTPPPQTYAQMTAGTPPGATASAAPTSLQSTMLQHVRRRMGGASMAAGATARPQAPMVFW